MGELSFPVPEYVPEDGSVVRPIQYYDSAETVMEDADCITVTAKGRPHVLKE